MSMIRTIVVSLLLSLGVGAFILAVPACDRQGPAERTGEQIDKAAEKAGDKLEEAGDTVKDAVK